LYKAGKIAFIDPLGIETYVYNKIKEGVFMEIVKTRKGVGLRNLA